MSLDTNLQDFATAVGTDVKELRSRAGNLTELQTAAKGSLVAAINEVRDASANASGIDDGNTSTLTTWSSSKISDELDAAIAGTVTLAEVDQRFEDLVNAAPAELDTLGELAAALADQDSAVAAINSALANRVRVDAAQSLTGPQQEQARDNINAAAADHQHPAADLTDSTAVGRAVLTATDATAARTALGTVAATDIGSTTTDYVAVYGAAKA